MGVGKKGAVYVHTVRMCHSAITPPALSLASFSPLRSPLCDCIPNP